MILYATAHRYIEYKSYSLLTMTIHGHFRLYICNNSDDLPPIPLWRGHQLRGGGGYKAAVGGGGGSEVLPLQKWGRGGGGGKIVGHPEGGHNKFWGSFNMGASKF